MTGPAACVPGAAEAPAGAHTSAVYADDEARAGRLAGLLREGIGRNEQISAAPARLCETHGEPDLSGPDHLDPGGAAGLPAPARPLPPERVAAIDPPPLRPTGLFPAPGAAHEVVTR